MHTSGSSCHTPAADVIEWEWLVIFYLMDIFHVVYKVICAPPPIVLSLKFMICMTTDKPWYNTKYCNFIRLLHFDVWIMAMEDSFHRSEHQQSPDLVCLTVKFEVDHFIKKYLRCQITCKFESDINTVFSYIGKGWNQIVFLTRGFLLYNLFLDWSLRFHVWVTQNTQLVAWCYYSAVVWNRDKPLAQRSWHAKCHLHSTVTTLPHWGTFITLL